MSAEVAKLGAQRAKGERRAMLRDILTTQVPAGLYTVGFGGTSVCRFRRSVRSVLMFTIVEGPHAGSPLPRFWHVIARDERPARTSNAWRDCVAIAKRMPPPGLIAASLFDGIFVEARIRIVEHGAPERSERTGRVLAPFERYGVIDGFERVVAGVPRLVGRRSRRKRWGLRVEETEEIGSDVDRDADQDEDAVPLLIREEIQGLPSEEV